jgi:hypothetical protein
MKNLYICDFEFLPVIFPDYKIVRECEYVKKNCVYVGRESIPGDLEAICVSPFLNRFVDISLPDNISIVRFVHTRKGKTQVPSQVEKHVLALHEKSIFMDELKRFMAVGKWASLADADARVYRMFGSLLETRRDFLSHYFTLREVYSFEHIWECILTFFRRVVDTKADLRDFTQYYRRIIEGFRKHKDQLSGVLSFLSRNHFDEIVLLDYLLGLRIY